MKNDWDLLLKLVGDRPHLSFFFGEIDKKSVTDIIYLDNGPNDKDVFYLYFQGTEYLIFFSLDSLDLRYKLIDYYSLTTGRGCRDAFIDYIYKNEIAIVRLDIDAEDANFYRPPARDASVYKEEPPFEENQPFLDWLQRSGDVKCDRCLKGNLLDIALDA